MINPVRTWRLVILALLHGPGSPLGLQIDPILDVERALGRVLQPADSFLGLNHGLQPGLRARVELELNAQELELRDLPELVPGPGHPFLPGQVGQKIVGRLGFQEGRTTILDGGIELADDLGLDGQEARGALRALRFGLRDGTAVAVEDGEFEGQAEGPFAVRLVELVVRAEADIGILLGDLEPEGGLAGRVFGEEGQDVRSVEDGMETDLSRGDVGLGAAEAIKGEVDAVERPARQAEGRGQK